jgi:predicted hotdog family 3-hydroxylacyl-ACP dehydratase
LKKHRDSFTIRAARCKGWQKAAFSGVSMNESLRCFTVGEFPAIEQVIPHRGRMRLLNAVVFHDEEKTVSEAVVEDRWPLAEDGSVNSIVLLEVVAQTAAAGVSLRELGGRRPESGYMVGVTKARFAKPSVPVGAVLTTTTSTVRKSDNYAVIRGVVSDGHGVVHESQVQVFRVPDELETAAADPA